MSTFKKTISKSITTLNMKTNNFVEQNKSKTYISTLEEEIHDLKVSIGDTIYANWKNGVMDIRDVEKYLTGIAEKEQLIEQQKERIRDIQIQERQILGTENSTDNSASTGQQEKAIFCSMCGAKNMAGYKFCVKCGREL